MNYSEARPDTVSEKQVAIPTMLNNKQQTVSYPNKRKNKNIERLENKKDERTFEKIIFSTVGVGATISLLFWLPSMIYVVNAAGFIASVQTTHSLRVGLDALTVMAAVMAFKGSKKR